MRNLMKFLRSVTQEPSILLFSIFRVKLILPTLVSEIWVVGSISVRMKNLIEICKASDPEDLYFVIFLEFQGKVDFAHFESEI